MVVAGCGSSFPSDKEWLRDVSRCICHPAVTLLSPRCRAAFGELLKGCSGGACCVHGKKALGFAQTLMSCECFDLCFGVVASLFDDV